VLHGVRVRVSPSAPNLKKADFMSAFFMSKIYQNVLFFGIWVFLGTFFVLVGSFLFPSSPKFVNLVRIVFL
jgi:hypothetical protein